MTEDVKKKVEEIESTISNKDEAARAVALVAEVVNMFTDKLVEVTERQVRLEERVEEVFEMLSQIEEEMIENLNSEFEAECPYCGEVIPFKIPEEGEDFECPKCGNVIELELMFGDDGCDCGSCGDHHCSGCHDDDDEEDED